MFYYIAENLGVIPPQHRLVPDPHLCSGKN